MEDTISDIREEMADNIIMYGGGTTIEYLSSSLYNDWLEDWSEEMEYNDFVDELLNEHTDDGKTLLYIAVEQNRPGVVNALLAGGADPNIAIVSGLHEKPLAKAYKIEKKNLDNFDRERNAIIINALINSGATEQ